jgi:hypothetical protein
MTSPVAFFLSRLLLLLLQFSEVLISSPHPVLQSEKQSTTSEVDYKSGKIPTNQTFQPVQKKRNR